MPLRDSIAALVAVAPEGTTVPLSWLRELLASEHGAEATIGAPDATVSAVDITVAECAARFGKGTSTVRTWLARGELPGAYRMHGREWRIPPSAIQALQREQAKQHRDAAPPQTLHQRGAVDLAAWRKHVPRHTTTANGR